MPFLADADVKQAVADALGVADPAALPAEWDAVVTRANADAQADVLAALVANRGYTAAQATGWDQAAAFNRAIATYYALIYGGGLHNNSDLEIGRFDRRKELATAGVLVAGVVVTPGDSATPAAVGRGEMNTGNSTLFSGSW